MSALVSLLKEDADLTMPPSPSWYQGRASIAAFFSSTVFPGRLRLMPTRANRQPAFAVYEREPQTGVYRALAIKVLRLDDGKVAAITGFADPALFRLFGLRATL